MNSLIGAYLLWRDHQREMGLISVQHLSAVDEKEMFKNDLRV